MPSFHCKEGGKRTVVKKTYFSWEMILFKVFFVSEKRVIVLVKLQIVVTQQL